MKVEWKKLGDVCQVLRGKRLTKSQLSETEGYPVLHGGSTPMGYYGEYNRKANTTVVVNTGNAGSVFFYDKEFWSSDACFSLYPNEKILDKFLYLYVYGCELILKGKIRAGAMPTIDAAAVESLQIPIPSLSEQQRIVGILDTFSSSIDNLKAQIALRRKQYEHYRDQLLDLEGKEGVEMKALGDICKLERGVRVIKKELQEEGAIPVFQNSLTPLGYYEKSNYPANTAFVICAGAAGEVGFSKIAFWAADDCTCIICSSIISSRYAYYLLLCKQHLLKSQVRKASVPRLSKNVIEKLSIPVPSLLEQSRIVSILDTFEASIRNLEAQLAERQKQYEYYRNQLLTFE